MGPIADGTKFIMTVPVSERNPEKALAAEMTKKYGKLFVLLTPKDNLEAYERAYTLIREKLQDGEAVTLLNRDDAQVTFYTPKRKLKAWSAWIRIVDVAQCLYN